MSMKEYIKWEDLDVLWEDVNDTWEAVYILIGIRKRGGSSAYYGEENPWEKNNEHNRVELKTEEKENIWDKLKIDIGEEKTNKVIKLYCKVNNIDYTQVLEGKKDIKISASNFENFAKEAIKNAISIKVKL